MTITSCYPLAKGAVVCDGVSRDDTPSLKMPSHTAAPFASMDEVDAEDFDLSNITDDENEDEFGIPFFDIWSDETED